jgi:translocation and assembly module TamA
MCKKIISIVLLLCSTTLYASLFGDDKKEIVLPTHIIQIQGEEVFDESDIFDALSAEHKSFFQFWKDDKATIKDKLIPTLDKALRNFYDSEGFYDAEFKIKETNTTVTIDVKENEPVKIRDINISSDYNISSLITLQKDEIFKAKDFIAIKSNILSQLLKDGYCSYDLDTKAYVDLEKHIVDIQYKLKKGGVCTFGKVTVKGLKSIDEEIVKSRVRAVEGERFSTERVQETSTAIYSLQSFDSVLIDVDRKFYNVVPVDIVVKEMEKPYHFEGGGGFDTYVGARVHATVVKHNFMGNAQQLSLRLAWSQQEQLAILDFYKPVLFNIGGFDIDLGASGGLSSLDFEGFHEKKVFAKAYLEHESERFKLITGMALEAIEISKLDDDVNLLPEDAYNTFLLAYPYLDVSYDGRDSKLNPKYGYFLRAYLEMGVPTDDQSSLYLKSEVEARAIYTVSNLTMAIVGKMGSIKMEDDTYGGIPESKKFFGGGAYSNRAYGFRELGIITSPTEYLTWGAMSMANLSLEFDYPVWGDLSAAAFTDNTMLTADSFDFTGEIITSVGVGVRYMTPVGPFKLDVGMNVQDASQYGISFQIGQSF